MDIPKFTFYDKENILIIITNLALYIYDGLSWKHLLINTINLPDTGFDKLKCSSIVEIFTPSKEYSKILMVTGGFNYFSKSSSKIVFMLNMTQSQCILDFKYSDMKSSRFLHGSLNLLNKFIFAFGGKNDKGFLSTCEYLSLLDNKGWIDFPSLPEPRANFSVIAVNSTKIFLYGGYYSNGLHCKSIINYCNVDINNISKSVWKSINVTSDNKDLIPLLSIRMIPYESNLIICGGTNGKQILNGIYELQIEDFNEEKDSVINMSFLGSVKAPRSNYHYLIKEEYFYLIGGALKGIDYDDQKTHINNYIEKFTFDLSNKIDSEFVKAASNDIIKPLIDLGIDVMEYKQEPGMPYSCSIITKAFN